ncbi:hypothetical protein HDV64DRAFT_256467, partial [Trichoderma sp. TUCIM 5745]
MAQPGPLSPLQQLAVVACANWQTNDKQQTTPSSQPPSGFVQPSNAHFGALGVLLPTPGPCHLSAFFSFPLPSSFPPPAPRLVLL